MQTELLNFFSKRNSSIAGRPQLERSLRLREDLGFDSLDLMRLAMLVYKQYGVDLGELAERGQKFDNVGDILSCLPQ